MTRHSTFILATLFAVSLLAMTISAKRYSSAHAKAQTARANLESVAQDAQEILHLRAQVEQIAWQQRPTEDVLALVNTVLTEAGIPSTRLHGVGNESDTTLPNQHTHQAGRMLHRQSLSVSLNDVTLSQLGEFLFHWQRTQSLWTIRQVEISHKQRSTQDNRYNVRLQVSAIYVSSI